MLEFSKSYALELDKSLEIAEVIRDSEAGHARDYRHGPAFDDAGDLLRLDAYTFGLLDALAQRIGPREDSARLLTYMHKLLQSGPGGATRQGFSRMYTLSEAAELAPYVAGGRYHVIKALGGRQPPVGGFARLLSEELAQR